MVGMRETLCDVCYKGQESHYISADRVFKISRRILRQLIELRRLLLTLLKFLRLSKMLPRLWLCKVYFPRPNVYFKTYVKHCNILDVPRTVLLHEFVSDPCQEHTNSLEKKL